MSQHDAVGGRHETATFDVLLPSLGSRSIATFDPPYTFFDAATRMQHLREDPYHAAMRVVLLSS